VPTISLAHLTPAQAKAFLVADNRLTENSEWNDRLLAEQLKELSLLELNFDLDVTGFGLAEIDLRIESLDDGDTVEDDALDQVPATAGPVVAHLGEIWRLGRHRLFCGSAVEASSYATLLEDKKAALVFVDPPYNVPVQGHVSGNGAIQHREFAMASGEMSEDEFIGFHSGPARCSRPTLLARGRRRHIALIAETAADARDVVVGDGKAVSDPRAGSGLLQVHPTSFRPTYEPSKRRLT
jgi:hypothetical protein